jgi:hypothetical protein
MPHLVLSRSVELTDEDAALMQSRDASVAARHEMDRRATAAAAVYPCPSDDDSGDDNE